VTEEGPDPRSGGPRPTSKNRPAPDLQLSISGWNLTFLSWIDLGGRTGGSGFRIVGSGFRIGASSALMEVTLLLEKVTSFGW
jgi:hypothetical protein